MQILRYQRMLITKQNNLNVPNLDSCSYKPEQHCCTEGSYSEQYEKKQ